MYLQISYAVIGASYLIINLKINFLWCDCKEED